MAKYLVTSALPYANGPIHFGHVAGAYLPADIYVRYLRMRGHQVLYVCGTDEHGVAITLRAEQEGIGYRESVDRWHAEIRRLFDRFGIEFDIFSGTARCPFHAQASQRFFRVLLEAGWIHDRVEEQWYSPAADRFLPDRYLQGICPECGHEQARGDECPACGAWIDARRLGDPISLIDGSKPILRETRHWYLDLPGLRAAGLDRWLQGADEERPHLTWKPNVEGHVQAMLADLQERPITRDLPWGVPVPADLPGAEGKVLYVWFDAPIGYISATMEWAAAQGEPEAWRDWWQDPQTHLVHFIGKDNIAFHLVVFPAMLLGQGDAWEGRRFVLPYNVPANEFYNLQGRKFSTSGGWYLDNEDFFSRYSADAARFHLALTAPETADSEFTWQGFQTTNNSLLADKLGNFASRVLKFAGRRFENRVPAATGDLAGHPALAEADERLGEVGDRLSRNELRKAAQALIAGCDALNRFFDSLAPWKLAKSEEQADRERCAGAIERCLAYLELLSRRLRPFCPAAAAELRTMLGRAAAQEGGLVWGEEGAGRPPAPLAAGAELGEARVLFRKIDDETIAEEIARLEARASS
ncbi:MAG: methionine--tRNA ligase [Planctomycetota bacterium]|nr:MAG: methionine--tRNA ligase [Planctomycetota bacterium]